MRRDRILFCAVAAALGIPFAAHAGTDPRLGTPQAMPDNNAATSLSAAQGQAGLGASVMASNVNWVGPFFTINNGTTVVGSWTDAGNWSPQIVPGVGAEAGGTATFGSNGDIVGDVSILNTDVTLSGIVLSAPSNVRIFSTPGGATRTVSTGGGTLTLDAPVETLRMSPSQRRFFGSTGREVLDFSIGGGGNVVKTGVGSVMLTRASTNNQFFLRQGTVLLTDGAAVNGGGSPAMAAHDDSVFGTGTLTIDGGTIRMVSQAATPLTFQFNHPVVIGPNGANIQPGADSPQFNADISGTGTLHIGYFGDTFYNHAMSYSGDTILDAGVFLHMIGDQASMLNSNIKNWARLDFEAGTESGNHDRLGDTKTMTMTGAGINVNGGGFDFSEKWGTTALVQGVNTITMYPNPGHSATLTMDNLTSTNGALLLIREVNSTATNTHSNVVVNNAPTMVGGGGAAGTTTQSIIPFAYGFSGTTLSDPDGGGVGTASLVTSTPTGLHPLDLATEYAGSVSGSANATDNVRITGSDAVGGAKTINALVMSSSDSTASGTPASVTGAGAITVTSGVILNTMTGTSIANPINFGATNGRIISIGTSTALPDDSGGSTANAITLGGAISGTGGLTVGGGGDTLLSGDSTYTGVTKLNNGQVFITKNVKADGVTPGPFGLSTTPIELRGATDNPTDPNSARFGTQDARLMNGTAGSISVDRDILATGQQSEFNDANGPVVGGMQPGNTLVLNGNVAIQGSKLIVRSVGTTIFNGVISGNGVLRDLEGGTIVLNSANTYTGGTEMEMLGNSDGSTNSDRGEKYVIGNNAAFGSGAIFNSGAGANVGRPTFIAAGGARTIANDYGGFAGFNVGGTNAFTMTGTIDLNAGNDTIVVTNTATTTFAGNLQRGGLIKGVKVDGTGVPNDTAVGTLVLSGNNSLMDGVVQIGQTAGTAAFSAGVLQATNSTSLGSGGMINNNTTIVSRSTLELNAIGGNIGLTDFITANGTGSNNLGAIHNLAGNNSTTGNVNLARFGTETANNTSIRVEAGTSFALNSLNDQSGSLTAASTVGPWIPATRTAGTAIFNKEGAGTLTVSRISNLRITADNNSPNPNQVIDRVPFDTLNVNAGTMAISLGRNTSNSQVIQPTAPPPTTPGAVSGPFLLSPSTNKTTIVKNLTIAAGATLDLGDNDMVQDYTGTSPLQSYRTMIQPAFAGGAWTGPGLTSAAARATSTSAHKTALGYAEASAVRSTFPATFSGVSVPDNTAILTRYTWSGDSNIDGAVDLTDFTFLAAHFNQVGGATWLDGDYNYDGNVDLTDFTFLASNFNQPAFGDAAGGGSSLGGLVPEPTSLGLMGLVAGGLLARRRRTAR